MQSPVRDPSSIGRTPSTGPRPAAMPGLLARVLSVTLLFLPGSAFAQAEPDWCQEVQRDRHCEVRELTLDTRDGRLAVDARPNGGIRVEGWNESDVRVQARLTTRARTDAAATELANEVEIRAEPGRLSSDGPRTGRGESWSVSYRIWVPMNTSLDLETTNGGVDVAGVAGAVDARTTNGGIDLRDLDGAVQARTTNGGVDASFSRDAPLQHDVDLQTTNGSVTLALPEGISARLEVSTTNGSIRTEFPITVQGRIDRSLSATLGEGGPEIRARTTNGGIRIRRN